MAMTESEARSKIKYRLGIARQIAGNGVDGKSFEEFEIALQALKEIREYRELGTVEELQALKEKNVIQIATIKLNKEDMQEIVDEKIKEFELDIIEIRNKAIDDYMNALCNKCLDMKNECYQLECPFCDDGCNIVNIAEQLKGGATDESTGSD